MAVKSLKFPYGLIGMNSANRSLIDAEAKTPNVRSCMVRLQNNEKSCNLNLLFSLSSSIILVLLQKPISSGKKITLNQVEYLQC